MEKLENLGTLHFYWDPRADPLKSLNYLKLRRKIDGHL